MLKMNIAHVGHVAARLDPKLVPGLPRPVQEARQAVLTLRTLRAPEPPNDVEAARDVAVLALLHQAATPPIDWPSVSTTAIVDALHRAEGADELKRLVVDARGAALASLVATLNEHQTTVVTVIQKQHANRADTLWSLLDGKHNLDAIALDQSVRKAVELMEHLRKLALEIGSPAHSVSPSLMWVRSARLRPVVFAKERLGEFGSAEFYVALHSEGCPVSELWCPTGQEIDDLDRELDDALRDEKRMAAAAASRLGARDLA
jgi:hypothetical protein